MQIRADALVDAVIDGQIARQPDRQSGIGRRDSLGDRCQGFGILGAVGGRYLFDTLRIHDPAIRGFAMGIASHGIGTARAFQISEQTGAFAALAMGLNGAFTALILPAIAGWLTRLG